MSNAQILQLDVMPLKRKKTECKQAETAYKLNKTISS